MCFTATSTRRRIFPPAGGAARRRQRSRRPGREGRAAIVVGGTGLYFNALTRGLAAVPPVPADVRAAVRARLKSDGVAALHAELAVRDPAMAARLMPADRARVSRALEVVLATGRSLGSWHAQDAPPVLDPSAAAKIFLMPERDALLRRIDARFDIMLAAGALDEVEALAARRLDPDLPAMRAHGVPWLIRHLRGEDYACGSGRRRKARDPAIYQTAGDLVPQPAPGIRLGRAGPGSGRRRSAVARTGGLTTTCGQPGKVKRTFPDAWRCIIWVPGRRVRRRSS